MSHQEIETSRENKEFSQDCKECRDLQSEDCMLKAYRSVMKDDMREVLKDELGTRDEIIKTLGELDRQNIPVWFGKRKIYIAPIAGLVSLFILLFELIFKHR